MATDDSSQRPLRSLLLLPSVSANSSVKTIRDAFKEPIACALAVVPPASELIVAVAGSFLPVRWSVLQSFLAALYSLSTSIQASGTSEDINVTYLLIDHVPERTYFTSDGASLKDTTVPDLEVFASRRWEWFKILHTPTKSTTNLLNAYLELAKQFHPESPKHIAAVTDGLKNEEVIAAEGAVESSATPAATELHNNVILAGTFDQFHAGHKLLLDAATILLMLPKAPTGLSGQPAQTVLTIGVTGDELLQNKKFASEIEPWLTRATSVIDFVSTITCSFYNTEDIDIRGSEDELRVPLCNGRLLVRCVRIADVYGPTITEEAIEAIVISTETKSGGAAVNKKREEQGWHALKVYIIDVLDATGIDGQSHETDGSDFAGKLSSTDIRRRKKLIARIA